jgi:hypothetical protein
MNAMTQHYPTASAVASLGGLSIAEALHDRICLLYLMLEGCPVAAQSVSGFDLEAGLGVRRSTDREALYKRLVEALCGYEEVTGGRVHPVNERLLGIAV